MTVAQLVNFPPLADRGLALPLVRYLKTVLSGFV